MTELAQPNKKENLTKSMEIEPESTTKNEGAKLSDYPPYKKLDNVEEVLFVNSCFFSQLIQEKS